MMEENAKPVANPLAVLREEFDDWAILFDPDSGNAFGLNPTSVFIWKLINGKNTIEDILQKVHENCENVPDEAGKHLQNFIKELTNQGFVGYETTNKN